ncbi:hypothetical protein [Rhodovulum sp. MB263]|uniref:hypothetical protein n=1 Tax=Rhodovulum sp. (strain MB263) TaxID=308754 RepID=UPI0009B7D2FE|nr:hypothetical protein [Rhodovulum sp. MB263]ARC87891.1 hypothetical protein B5V46_04295 [Rhodovulum sp. MB263]
MPKDRACANSLALLRLPFFGRERAYWTGKRLRARWQRFRLWRAYRRPVTFEDLRRVAYDANRACPEPYAAALFDRICREAEKRIIDC